MVSNLFQYEKFVLLMDRLATHKYAKKYEEFIAKNRQFLAESTQQFHSVEVSPYIYVDLRIGEIPSKNIYPNF